MLKKLLSKLMGRKKAKRPAAKPRRRGLSRPKRAPAKRKASTRKAKAARTQGGAKRQAKRRKPQRARPTPQGPPPGAGPEVGRVVAFFRIPVVAVIKVTHGGLKTGDRVWIKGHTTDMKLAVASMQINHQPVQEIRKGDEAGVKVSARARRGDRVYLMS